MKSLAHAMHRFRWSVIGLWLVALVALQVLVGVVGSGYGEDLKLADSESTRAFTLLEEHFPARSNADVQVVFKAAEGRLTDKPQRAAVGEALEELAALDHVESVGSFYAKNAVGRLSADRTIGYVDVVLDQPEADLPASITLSVIDTAQSHATDSLQVASGGGAVLLAERPGGGKWVELVAVLAAFVILAVTFGTLVSTLVPLVTALVALGSSLALVGIASNVFAMPDFGPILASLIGLGVGIDYALFLVSRFRGELHRGRSVHDAVVIAVNTSGRAVTFAGIVVCIALLGMLVLGMEFLTGAAVAASIAVAVTMLASVTLLPALLSVLGHNIDKVRLRPQRAEAGEGDAPGRWDRWAELVRRRPLISVVAGLLLVAIVAAPAAALRLGFSDAGAGATDKTSRQAYDLIGEGFGRGANGPLLVVATLESTRDADALPRLAETFRETDGVATVAPARVNQEGTAALITIIPTSGPQDDATARLLDTLRDDVIPPVVDGTGVTTYVGGSTALAADFSSVLEQKTPQFIAVVVVLSMLLLVAVFRSIAIPLKAAVMNLLSIAAAFGAVVAVFQWGWAADLIGLSGTGPIEPFIPVVLFAILFGLSMDYEVFLVSRMHEEWTRTGDNVRAVAGGLGATAGVITAAAVIMIAVFGAFILFPVRVVMVFGVGLAVAVFVDAFIIRSLIVPGIMFLLGRWNWYLPAWLDRIVPTLSVEGSDPDEPVRERAPVGVS